MTRILGFILGAVLGLILSRFLHVFGGGALILAIIFGVIVSRAGRHKAWPAGQVARGREPRRCPQCGDVRVGRFCARCGAPADAPRG